MAPGAATGAGATQQPLSFALTADSSLNKLVDCVTGLTKMQESFITQQSNHHQIKMDGLQSIHFTTSNFIRRISSTDGQNMTPSLTPLATSMLSSKKKDVALELFMLELNARGIRCQITPAFLDALFTGNIATKSASEIPQASSFGCAVSLAGTRLEDIDVSLVLRKADESEDLSPKEKSALYQDTVLICTSANQLSKVLNITAAIFESYSGPHSLIALWLRGWYKFVVDEEEFIAEITRTVDRDLPPKIQCLIASTVNDYLTEGRFFVPSDAILDTDDIKRTIKRRYCPYELLPAIRDILHPSLPNPKTNNPRNPPTTNNPRNPPTTTDPKPEIKFSKHKDRELISSQQFFRKVIQKNGLFLVGVPNPMLDDDSEECAKYLFTGACGNPKCSRRGSHTPPTGQRKVDALKFKSECLQRYLAAKGPSDPDFH